MSFGNGSMSPADIAAVTNNNGGGFGSWGNDWWILLLFLWGGYGSWGMGGMGGGYMNGVLTRAELYDGFAMQNIDSAVRGVQQGICDSTYALNNTLMNGFHGVDRGLCDVSHPISDCCCQTQNSIQNVRYDMATGLCNLGNTIQSGFRDVIDSNRDGVRQIMDFMVNEKLSSKDAQIAALQAQLREANQNAVIGARIDAATAEILRRSGHDCPSAAYIVNPPTPVSFNGNGCGFAGACAA